MKLPRWALVTTLLVVLLAIGLIPRWRLDSRLSAASAEIKQGAPSVIVAQATEIDDPGLVLPGSTVATQVAAIQARSTGYVKSWNVDIGSSVKRGQLLATVEAPEVDAQYTQARNQSLQSSANLRQAESDAQKLAAAQRQTVAQRDSVSQALSQARANRRSAASKVTAAKRAYKLAQANLRYDQSQLTYAVKENARYQKLVTDGFVTLDQSEQIEATAKSAQAKVEADQEAVRVAASNIDDAQASYQAAVAAVDSATSNLRAAEENIHVSEAAYISGQRAIESNQAGLAATQGNEQHYQAMQGFEQVRAPFDGVITARNVDVGSLINAPASNAADTNPNNTAPTVGLFGIARLDPMEVDVSIPQAHYSEVTVGQKATMFLQELPSSKIEGTVSALSGALDGSSRTRLARVRVKNPKGLLRPGMFAQVHFAATKGQTLRVPSTSLMINGHGTRIAVVTADNHIDLRSVTLGRDLGLETEVLSGIEPKQTIVLNPPDSLVQGMAVEPLKPESPTTPAAK